MFFGSVTHKLDDKNRLAIPSKFRKLIKGKIFLSIDLTSSYLELLPLLIHNKRQEFLNSFDEFNLASKKIKLFLNAQTYELTIDSAKRIKLPNELVEKFKLKQDVVIIGNGDRIVLQNKDTYQKDFKSISKNQVIEKILKNFHL